MKTDNTKLDLLIECHHICSEALALIGGGCRSYLRVSLYQRALEQHLGEALRDEGLDAIAIMQKVRSIEQIEWAFEMIRQSIIHDIELLLGYREPITYFRPSGYNSREKELKKLELFI
jgi:hypothetical protein